MKAVYNKVNSGEKPGDLSVVMNPYDSERGGNLPETQDEIQAYYDMCLKFLEQMGLDHNAGGICLELGNETNVDHSILGSNGEPMFTTEDFADRADPKMEETYMDTADSLHGQFLYAVLYPECSCGVASDERAGSRLSGAEGGSRAAAGACRRPADAAAFHP
jgi:hypothetical protein